MVHWFCLSVYLRTLIMLNLGLRMRDLSCPQCQPNQTYCTAGEALLTLSHSGASRSHNVSVISSAIKQCTLFLTCLGPVRKKVHAIIQPHIPSSMVWPVLLLETFKKAFVCFLTYCRLCASVLPCHWVHTVQNGVFPSRKYTVCTVCGCFLIA